MTIAWFMALSVIGGYLWLAPDPVSLAASRAVSGAVRSGWSQARAKHEELRPVTVHGGKTPASTGPARGPRGRAGGPRARTGRTGRPGAAGRTGGPVRAKAAGTTGPRPHVPVDQPVTVVYGRAPVWPVVRAGMGGAVQGGREAVRTARRARREGTDHTSRLRRALRAGWATAGVFTGGLQGAEGGFWNRIRAGFAAVAGARAQAKDDQEAQEAEEARAAKEKEEQEKAQVKAAKAAAKTPTPGGEQAGAPVPAGTTTQQEDVMTGMSGIGGDLENVSDLRGETTRVQSVLDDIADQVAEVSSWAVNLGDRINEAPFETAALITQAAEIAEALAGLRGLDDASDVLTGMDGALKEAEALGEHADEVAAGGNVGAFRAS